MQNLQDWVGTVRRAWLGSGFTRLAKVLAIDSHGELALVKYIEYDHLPTEWLPIDRLQ